MWFRREAGVGAIHVEVIQTREGQAGRLRSQGVGCRGTGRWKARARITLAGRGAGRTPGGGGESEVVLGPKARASGGMKGGLCWL